MIRKLSPVKRAQAEYLEPEPMHQEPMHQPLQRRVDVSTEVEEMFASYEGEHLVDPLELAEITVVTSGKRPRYVVSDRRPSSYDPANRPVDPTELGKVCRPSEEYAGQRTSEEEETVNQVIRDLEKTASD